MRDRLGRHQMVMLYLPQFVVAAAGGMIGGLSGFIANSMQRRRDSLHLRKNVAGALIGEISALTHQIRERYILTTKSSEALLGTSGHSPHHRARTGRDYMPVFHGLGGNIGILPSPLPRDLVLWYSTLVLCLDGERDLHELAVNHDPDVSASVADLTEAQRLDFSHLLDSSVPLLKGLSRL